MNNHARGLFCTLVGLFATSYQQESFKALMASFLKGDGCPHPSRASGKSESALSRFLNRYAWNARALTRHVRGAAISSLLGYYAHRRGRRPRLLVLIDLTTLEKAGRFEQLGLVSVLNKKRGLHLVVMYLVAGPLRLPWGFRVWRGKGEASGAELALSLLRTLPQVLLGLNPLVLADGGFGTTAFLVGVKRLGLDAVVGMRRDRRLVDGRSISQARCGERVTLLGLPFPVTVARYHLPRHGGRETRFVVATFVAAARVISRWGRRRWRIEAFFKTCKSRFGLARFAQATRTGAYRFLLLSFLAFTLTQWQLWQSQGEWPDWAEAATTLRRELLPDLILAELMSELERLRPYLKAAELPPES
jgi:hypothetical protein